MPVGDADVSYSINSHGGEDITVSRCIFLCFAGDRQSLERAIIDGDAYLKLCQDPELTKEKGINNWKGSCHVLALTWLGQYTRASTMVLAMLTDDRMSEDPNRATDLASKMVPSLVSLSPFLYTSPFLYP